MAQFKGRTVNRRLSLCGPTADPHNVNRTTNERTSRSSAGSSLARAGYRGKTGLIISLYGTLHLPHLPPSSGTRPGRSDRFIYYAHPIISNLNLFTLMAGASVDSARCRWKTELDALNAFQLRCPLHSLHRIGKTCSFLSMRAHRKCAVHGFRACFPGNASFCIAVAL